MIQLVGRMIFPFALMVSAALLVKGYADVGDGFSAGIVAGLGAVAQYVCLDHTRARRTVGAAWVWPMATLGLLLALLTVLTPVFAGLPPVYHVPRPGEHVPTIGTLELHTAVLFDAGVLVLVYATLVGTFDRLFPVLRGDEE